MKQKLALMTLCIVTAGVLSTGCLPSDEDAIKMREAKRPDHIKAVWVTRMDYKTEQDVRNIIKNCQDMGMNTVVFQIRGNGTVFYPSKIEPWAEQFDFKDPGYDPLKVAIEEAHKRGMRLEAYVNVMPAWKGPNPPKCDQQLYHTHPEWFWYDKDGNRQPLNHKVGNKERGWYVSVNPCLPEVRNYLTRVFKEIATNYDIDGLHLDYIRFPNEHVVPGEIIPDYPRDAKTLALYKKETGKTPDEDKEAWVEWRCQQVTKLIQQIRVMLNKTRPGADLTAAVGADPARSREAHFRDSRTWADMGLLDVYYIMNYKPKLAAFQKGIDNWKKPPKNGVVAQGIGAWRVDGKGLTPLLEASWNADGNFCLFAYSSFYSGAEDGSAPKTKAQKQRKARLDSLKKFLAEKK